MATIQQIRLLIEAHFKNENDKFRTVALQIAANEARKGHNKSAQEIKKIIDDEYKNLSVSKFNRYFPNDEVGELVTLLSTNNFINEMILNENINDKIVTIINEYENRNKLLNYGLKNKRKLLLYGPPGTGKTTTASAIAGELQLPVYLVNLDNIVTKYLGETNNKLRKVFDIIDFNQGVYLFDEFDAIAGDRNRDNDVGEMRRVVNTFLQLLERDNSSSIIIAATNNKILLDKALFRRFDEIIYYDFPKEKEIFELILYILKDHITKKELRKINCSNYIGLSHSEITNACKDALKRCILSDDQISANMIDNCMKNRMTFYNLNGEE